MVRLLVPPSGRALAKEDDGSYVHSSHSSKRAPVPHPEYRQARGSGYKPPGRESSHWRRREREMQSYRIKEEKEPPSDEESSGSASYPSQRETDGDAPKRPEHWPELPEPEKEAREEARSASPSRLSPRMRFRKKSTVDQESEITGRDDSPSRRPDHLSELESRQEDDEMPAHPESPTLIRRPPKLLAKARDSNKSDVTKDGSFFDESDGGARSGGTRTPPDSVLPGQSSRAPTAMIGKQQSATRSSPHFKRGASIETREHSLPPKRTTESGGAVALRSAASSTTSSMARKRVGEKSMLTLKRKPSMPKNVVRTQSFSSSVAPSPSRCESFSQRSRSSGRKVLGSEVQLHPILSGNLDLSSDPSSSGTEGSEVRKVISSIEYSSATKPPIFPQKVKNGGNMKKLKLGFRRKGKKEKQVTEDRETGVQKGIGDRNPPARSGQRAGKGSLHVDTNTKSRKPPPIPSPGRTKSVVRTDLKRSKELEATNSLAAKNDSARKQEGKSKGQRLRMPRSPGMLRRGRSRSTASSSLSEQPPPSITTCNSDAVETVLGAPETMTPRSKSRVVAVFQFNKDKRNTKKVSKERPPTQPTENTLHVPKKPSETQPSESQPSETQPPATTTYAGASILPSATSDSEPSIELVDGGESDNNHASGLFGGLVGAFRSVTRRKDESPSTPTNVRNENSKPKVPVPVEDGVPVPVPEPNEIVDLDQVQKPQVSNGDKEAETLQESKTMNQHKLSPTKPLKRRLSTDALLSHLNGQPMKSFEEKPFITRFLSTIEDQPSMQSQASDEESESSFNGKETASFSFSRAGDSVNELQPGRKRPTDILPDLDWLYTEAVANGLISDSSTESEIACLSTFSSFSSDSSSQGETDMADVTSTLQIQKQESSAPSDLSESVSGGSVSRSVSSGSWQWSAAYSEASSADSDDVFELSDELSLEANKLIRELNAS